MNLTETQIICVCIVDAGKAPTSQGYINDKFIQHGWTQWRQRLLGGAFGWTATYQGLVCQGKGIELQQEPQQGQGSWQGMQPQPQPRSCSRTRRGCIKFICNCKGGCNLCAEVVLPMSLKWCCNVHVEPQP